ncbi:MAG TPA: hypothetical protein VH482_07560 [Thermomicrobiales bacterium]|jgi:hypothetical protein
MTYDLWDVETGNAVAFERTPIEMAAVVRMLIGEHGSACADQLHLTVKEDAGAVRQTVTGPALLAWAEAVQRDAGDPAAGDGRVLASTAGAGSSGLGTSAKADRVAQRAGAGRQTNRRRFTPTAPKRDRAGAPRDH